MDRVISVPYYIAYLEAEVERLSFLVQAQNAHFECVIPYLLSCDGIYCAATAKSVDGVYMWLAETISHNNASGKIPPDFYEKVKNIYNMTRLREVVKVEPGITLS